MVFGVMKDEGVQIKTLMGDFEKGPRSAVRSVYGASVQIKGCWFHYTQAIMKRIKKIGLQASYANLPLVNKTVRRLFALPFIMPWEVEQTFGLIVDDVADFTPENVRVKLYELFDYFRRTWIGKYPPDEWNQSLDVSMRSNNWSEAFHSSFARRFVRGHPNIRVVIEALKRVENTLRVTWNEFKTRPRPKKQDNFADELIAIMEMRERRWSDDTLGFVDALSRIPIVIMLRYEKRQLEFWRENCEGEDVSHDMADRRISEVTSLLDGDQTSLLEIRECLSCADVREHMDIITKSALERRKQRPREKIEEIKKKAVNSQRVQRMADKCLGFAGIKTSAW